MLNTKQLTTTFPTFNTLMKYTYNYCINQLFMSTRSSSLKSTRFQKLCTRFSPIKRVTSLVKKLV